MARDFSHRIGKKTVRFVDKNGAPIKNKAVKADMTNHEFLFGAGLFDVIPYAANEMTDINERKIFERKLEHFTKLLNNTTLPFYWTAFETIPQAAFEPIEGKPRHKELMAAAQLLKKYNITLKGHPLCWHSACGHWLMKYPQEEIVKKQFARIKRNGLFTVC